MERLKPITKHEQFIAGKNGKAQYVVVPADEYGLGLAMKKAMKDKMYSKNEALKMY